MARDTRAAFLRELRKIEPRLARAFAAAIQDIRSTAQRRAIEEAIRRGIETGNIFRAAQEVQAALQLGQEFFAPLDRAMMEAFETGAVWQLSTLPKKPFPNTVPRLVVRFNGRHPRAEAWTRNRSAELITEITEDTMLLVRETIDEGARANRPYRKIAADLIGSTEGNQLKGGLIGLHSRQAAAVRKARAELEAGEFTAFLRRPSRNKRFDRTLAKATREGLMLKPDDVDKIVGLYSDRLLKERGNRIARTELNRAMNAGRSESIQQMIDNGEILAEHITVFWDATPDSRTRDSHSALGGTSVTWGEFFTSPVTGANMRWPYDDGAPAAEVVNCRCSARFRIDWAAVAAWRERRLAA